jgi:hypothetical protein
LPGTNALAYCKNLYITALLRFIKWTPDQTRCLELF